MTTGSRPREPAAPGVDGVPGALDTPRAKLVYLYLRTVEAAKVERISSALGIGKLALFPVLSTLSRRGLVERRDGEYVARPDATADGAHPDG